MIKERLTKQPFVTEPLRDSLRTVMRILNHITDPLTVSIIWFRPLSRSGEPRFNGPKNEHFSIYLTYKMPFEGKNAHFGP